MAKSVKAPSKARVATGPKAVEVLAAPAAPASPFTGLGARPDAPEQPAAATVIVQRGKLAVTQVKVGTVAYHTASPHTAAAWQRVLAILADGPKPVDTVVTAMGTWPKAEKPSAFVAYCVRRNYLAAA